MLHIVILVVLIILMIFLLSGTEAFDPYVGKMVPYLVNSGVRFDEPDIYNQILNPYYGDQYNSEHMLWEKLHRIQLETPL